VESREVKDRFQITGVGGFKRTQVTFARRTLALQVGTTPFKSDSAEILDQPVGAESRMATVSVSKRMNADQLVVKVNRKAVSVFCALARSVREVVTKLSYE